MIASDARVLLQLLRGQPRRGSHAQRLEAFYGPQAQRYDQFRERLLHGRQTLIDRLPVGAGARLVELGAGTGRNLLFFGQRLSAFERFELVDLCPSLLALARQRTADMPNVGIVEADATCYQPSAPVDAVYLSYALTMIPRWQDAIENALAMLRPGGHLGVVDFYVSHPDRGPGAVRHGLFTRWFWPSWFAHDGVRPDPRHLQCLRDRVPDHQLLEQRAPVPYLPGLRVPYYVFVGRRS